MTDDPVDVNERITEQWKADTSSGERVRTVMRRTYDRPPPNASSDDDDVEASCIGVSEPVLVAGAVHQLWRAGFENDSVDPLNDLPCDRTGTRVESPS